MVRDENFYEQEFFENSENFNKEEISKKKNSGMSSFLIGNK